MTRSMDSLKAFVARNGGGLRIEPRPGVLIVGAGKGGVGTSTVSALMALGAAERGLRVLLVDADENVGGLHLLFGLPDPGPGIGALKGGDVTPSELLVGVSPGLQLLPGGGAAEDGTLAGAVAERRTLLSRVASLYERFDLVVVDGGSRLESVMAACRTGAERLMAVTAPDRISLAAGYALFKVARVRFPDLPVEVVVNGTSSSNADEVFSVVQAAAATFLASPLSHAGSVPEDAALHAALEAGRTIQDAGPGSDALEAVGRWVHRFDPHIGQSSLPLIRQG